MLCITVEKVVWELGVEVGATYVIQTGVKLIRASWRRRHLSCFCGECDHSEKNSMLTLTSNPHQNSPAILQTQDMFVTEEVNGAKQSIKLSQHIPPQECMGPIEILLI